MHITITDAEYRELMRVKREYEKFKNAVFGGLRQSHVNERNKITDTVRHFLPCYKKKLSKIDKKLDQLKELEELLK